MKLSQKPYNKTKIFFQGKKIWISFYQFLKMNSENKFILLKILQEIEFNLKNSRIDFEGLIQMIINKRIFITGAGRTGLIMKSFGIRMQLGFDVFFYWGYKYTFH